MKGPVCYIHVGMDEAGLRSHSTFFVKNISHIGSIRDMKDLGKCRKHRLACSCTGESVLEDVSDMRFSYCVTRDNHLHVVVLSR